jgi:hypothetical protein
MSHYDFCVWCNTDIDEESSYEVAVYDEDDNEIGSEAICSHCFDTFQYNW